MNKLLRNFMENDIKDEVEDDNYIIKFVSCKDALKISITLHNFLLKLEKLHQSFFNILRKVIDEF
jgi:hypothetical protein